MADSTSALEQALLDYREEAEAFERKSKPTDGLLGFGRSLKDDVCHERLDRRVEAIVREACAAGPAPEEALQLAHLLLRGDQPSWPLACQWMLRALERHSIPLIPFLDPEDAAALLRAYTARYKPWDRLPAQKEVIRALKARA